MASTTILGHSLIVGPTLLAAVRIAPLVSSTASLTHAYMEWLTTRAFIIPSPISSSLTQTLSKSRTVSVSEETAKSAEKELAAAENVVIPIWFTTFFNTAVQSVIGFNTVTLASSALNLNLGDLGDSRIFYTVGLAAATAHYLFVPGVTRSVQGLMKMAVARQNSGSAQSEEEGQAKRWIAEWVGVHTMRMSTVDVAAWLCFGMGVVGVVREKV